MTIVFNDIGYGRAISAAAGTAFNPEVDQCIARVDGERLLGGVIYQGYTGASIGIHMAGFDPHWASKDMLWVSFHYPFVQLGCKKLFAQVPAYNERALEIDRKLGFKEETRVRDVFPSGDLVVLSMIPDECRWLRIRPRNLAG